jgi:tetratricopeptide (TPR) repeat protein
MKNVILLLLVFHISLAGFSQAVGSEAAAPFVSKLKVKAIDSHILLTWRNPKDLQGFALLYRHTGEIGRENLDQAQLVTRLLADQESYEDTPSDDRPYYYAVLIEDSTGKLHELFVPFRNKTSEGVRVAVQPPEESVPSSVTGIQAMIVEDSIQVRFQSSNPDRDLLLFRSNTPMRSIEDLLEALAPIQLESGTTRFTDYPIPGIEVYYAVIDTDVFKLGKQELVAGQNSTDRPVAVPLEVERVALPPAGTEGQRTAVPAPPTEERGAQTALILPISPTLSAQPAYEAAPPVTLPYLQLGQDSSGRFALPQQAQQLDPQTQAAIARILSDAPPIQAKQRSVVILPEDKSTLAAGESASLQKILREYLATGDYQGAETKLRGFLNLRRSAYTEARVRFYLAQAYYFQGLYEEALLEFVLAQDELYAPVQPWLESCFRRLWNKP